MPSQVQNLLRAHGPSLTSDLIAEIVKTGVSEAAARQRITRARADYKRLAGLKFAKNARFLYLPDQWGDEKFWEALEKAFEKSGKAYWSAVVGLQAKGGICLKSEFPIVCGAPIARSGQLSPQRVYERLETISLLEEKTDPVSGDVYIRFVPYFYQGTTYGEYRAVSLAEFVAIQAIKDWARKIGFGSYGAFRTRLDDPLPVVSSLAWDISAPSYARPLVSAVDGALKPGFFVCDVSLNGVISKNEVTKFIRKYDLAAAPPKVRPILPFLVGGSFDNDAFDLAKSKGILAVTIPNLFGDAVLKALEDLVKLLTDTGATASVNPDHLYKVLSELTKIEGAANNLRGSLFELAIGSLLKDTRDGFLKAGLVERHLQDGRQAEIDALFDYNNSDESLVVECKAKIPGSQVSLADVKKWYNDRVPLIAEILYSNRFYEDRVLHFEIWTNGTYHPAALKWLNSQPKQTESYSLDWKSGDDVKKEADKSTNSAIRKTLNEHYFKNPMTKIVAEE